MNDNTATGGRPRWWVEISITLVFYAIYSTVRNQFGSAIGGTIRDRSLLNAERVIDFERALHLFHEQWIQRQFIDYDWFIRFWNIFYGSFHFAVTLGAMVFLFRRHPVRYLRMRSALASTTALALVGFATFPLMPPRLLENSVSQFGGRQTGYGFVDTLIEPGGLWSFDSGTLETISNQYAAMPSLHIAWAAWCVVALYPVLRSRYARILTVAYPFMTLFAIIVTANHYWIDAVGGLVALAVGLIAAPHVERLLPGLSATLQPEPGRLVSQAGTDR